MIEQIEFDRFPTPAEFRVASEVRYYLQRLDDLSLLDRAVIVDKASIAFTWVDKYGVCRNGPASLPAYCVPAGGSRRSGSVVTGECPAAQQKVIDALSGVPGFPNPRPYDGVVMWGDDFPDVPVGDIFRHDWLHGVCYGYSLEAIVFQLGRRAAMSVCPDFLAVERATGGQVRSFDGRVRLP